jgi:primary-amine oxidase
MSSPDAGAAARTGTLVAPNLLAVHHDHFFSFRLDLDVDGARNSFVRERLVSASFPPDSRRRSAWRVERVPMPVEGGLSGHHGTELWRIEGATAETPLGHRRSYQIEVHGNATSLLGAEDWPQRRAAFSGESMWVTARRPGELFAGGRYPNQSPGSEGLPTYVNGDSVIANDLVAWPTIGFHHVTRPEDWPVLPTVWHTIRLRPHGFFSKNPTLGIGGDAER